ncbi:MAG: response regulator [Chryseolinea sp.]
MKTVILIDDDPDELELMQQAITDNYQPVDCLAYSDPEEALKAILSNTSTPPDVIFIDINMPKLTGDMCLQVIRKELALNSVVVAMHSTSMDSENQVFLMRRGADFAFQKPYKVEEYRQVVLQVLNFSKPRSSYTPGSFF